MKREVIRPIEFAAAGLRLSLGERPLGLRLRDLINV